MSRCRSTVSRLAEDHQHDFPKLHRLGSARSAFQVAIAEIHVQTTGAVAGTQNNTPFV